MKPSGHQSRHIVDAYRQALQPYQHMRVLAAWTAGSRLHGLADEHSDIDVIILTAPTVDDILLGHVGRPVSLHDPDITLLDPIALHHGVVKGSPNMLEWLDAPDDSLLMDTDAAATLRAARPTPAGMGTLRMLDGNIRANLHRLDKNPPEGRRLWRLRAETLRLAWTANRLASTGVTPARLDTDERDILRAIRHGRYDEDAVRLMVDHAVRARREPRLPEQADATMFKTATIGIMHGLVESWTRTLPMGTIVDRLAHVR